MGRALAGPGVARADHFFSVGGIEVINTARLRAYLETVGSPLDSGSAVCGCDTLTNELFEQLPYTAPDDPGSPAP